MSIKNFKTYLCLVALYATSSILSMEQENNNNNRNNNNNNNSKWSHNTYKGTEITSENLWKLSIDMTDKMWEEVEDTLSEPKNTNFIKKLLKFPVCKNVEELKAVLDAKEKILKQNWICNVSKFNYVFRLDNRNFVIKISGPLNIIRTKIATVLDIDPYSKKLSEFDLEKVTSDKTPIYQHVSAAAYYLRLFEISNSFKYLKIIPTYLYEFDDYSAPYRIGKYSDENLIVIQELYDNNKITELHTLNPQEIKEILENLPERAVKELFLAIKHAALWNFWSNLLVNRKNKQELLFGDLEQPNNSKSKNLFYKGEEGFKKYNHDANCGLLSGKEANETRMYDALEAYAPKHFELWKKLLNQDWLEFFDEMTK